MHQSREAHAAVVAAIDAVNYADCLRERRDGARSFQRLVRWYQWDQKG